MVARSTLKGSGKKGLIRSLLERRVSGLRGEENRKKRSQDRRKGWAKRLKNF
jgi:hypothetical protein